MLRTHNPTPTELKKQQAFKDVLFWQSPYCRCCGKLMVKVNIPDGQKQPENLATLEHIYPASDLRRHTSNGSRYWTLFCKKCNGDKGSFDCGSAMWVRYVKEHPAFDIRSLLTIHKSRSRWFYLLRKRNTAIRKGKTFNIEQYR